MRKTACKVVLCKRCGEKQAWSVAGLRCFAFKKKFDTEGVQGLER